jgi:hypothetical protein
MLNALVLLAYIACVPAANWLIGHVGVVCVPRGPCLIPVGFGLTAPSGVLLAGLALVLQFLAGQLVGKAWMVFGATLVLWVGQANRRPS